MRFLSTERLAGLSARRPRRVVAAWVLAFVAAVAIIATLLPSALTTDVHLTGDQESRRADVLLSERLPESQRVVESLVVHSPALTVDDPAFRAKVASLRAELGALGSDVVAATGDPYAPGGVVAPDRHTAIVPVTMQGDLQEAGENAAAVLAVQADANGRDGFEVGLAGQAAVGEDFNVISGQDLVKGELIGMPTAFVILLVVFGALVASFVPVVLAVVSIVVALALTALVGQVSPLSFFVVNMLTMMGLAVGIDYSLFILSRYREERAGGREVVDAIRLAGATSSRAVFFSGTAVVVALLGMLIVPNTIFISLGAGAILVVAVAVVAALTLLPAVIALLGDRIDRLRLPRRRRADLGRPGVWQRLAAAVTRRPALSLALGVAVMVLAALPFVDLRTGNSGVESLPASAQSRQAFELIEREFGAGSVSSAQVVVDGDATDPALTAAVARVAGTLDADPAFGPASTVTAPDGRLTVVTAPVAGDPDSPGARAAVTSLREEVLPDAFAGVGADALVTGPTATSLDQVAMTEQYLPIVVGSVLALSFVLLLVAFRSIVVPAMAIVMNLLSVGAAYGLLVLVMVKGMGNELFGFSQVDTIESWLPLFLFSVLFGLSMDYHVFLLSRIRELYTVTGDNRASIVGGVGSTSRLILGAALIMVAVFAGFAAGELVAFQQMGFGLAVAILIDATIVRTVLVPAAMQLLGDWNWYLPRFLSFLPELDVEGRRPPATAAAGD